MHATERTVPVTSERSLDLLFDGFLRRAATENGGSVPKLRDWVKCRGNRSAAARLLGIGRRTLYTKMEKLEIISSFSVSLSNDDPGALERDLLFP